jgi:hypothetical protein
MQLHGLLINADKAKQQNSSPPTSLAILETICSMGLPLLRQKTLKK